MAGKAHDALLDQLPDGVCWCQLGTVLSVGIHRCRDPENWRYRYDGELVLSDCAGTVRVRLTLENVTGDLSLCVGREISGLQILDTREWGYQADCRYQIRDYEENDIAIYCQGIKVEVLEGGG